MRLRALLALTWIGAACSEQSAVPAASVADETPVDFEALRSLGYVDFAESGAEPWTGPGVEPGVETGLVHATPDPERGYTLVVSIPHCTADLVGPEGEVARSWRATDAARWFRAKLSIDGDLVVIGRERERSPETDFLACYDWDGDLRWRASAPVHHDFDWSPEGEIVALGKEVRTVAGEPVEDNPLLFFSPEGELLRSLSLLDVLVQHPEVYELPRFRPSANVQGAEIFHANSICWMDQPQLEGEGDWWRPTNVALSIRNQNLVVIVDTETRELVWSWGPGELELQHEATFLANGNLLLFDNGALTRDYSRLLQVDPRTDSVVWEYTTTPPQRFFSSGRGTTEAIPGGGVLTANSNSGEVFELDGQGEIVWAWINPHGGESRGVVRAHRYPRARVESWSE